MKKLAIVLIVAVSSLAGCGIVKDVACNGMKSQLLCLLIDGDTDARLDHLEKRELEQDNQLANLDARMQSVEGNLNYLLTKNKYVDFTIGNMQAQIDATYMQLGQLAAQVAGLPSTSVSVIDPCPQVASTNAKEMLLVIGSKTVAYFEDGSNRRFLAEIKPGVLYRTTDSRACSFSL